MDDAWPTHRPVPERRPGDLAWAAFAREDRPDPEFEDSVLRITRTLRPHGLSIAGELDAARHAAFAAALTSAMTSAPAAGELHLDCAELRFIDLGALRLLADFAARHAGSGALILDRVPRHLRDVIDLVGWGRLPGIRLGDVVP